VAGAKGPGRLLYSAMLRITDQWVE